MVEMSNVRKSPVKSLMLREGSGQGVGGSTSSPEEDHPQRL